MTDEQIKFLMVQSGCAGVLTPAVRRFALAAAAAGRDRCVAWVHARRDDFYEEHGHVDPETGTLEFGMCAHAQAKEEYVADLENLAEGLRTSRFDEADPKVPG